MCFYLIVSKNYDVHGICFICMGRQLFWIVYFFIRILQQTMIESVILHEIIQNIVRNELYTK